jgi:hypothetical protein
METNIGREKLLRPCRKRPTSSQRERHLSWREIFPHAKIVFDPKKLAQLNSEIEKRDSSIRTMTGTPEKGR